MTDDELILAYAQALKAADSTISFADKEREKNVGEWLRYYFPHLYPRPFTQSQEEFFAHIQQIAADVYFEPICLCDPRGLGKSTVTEGAGVWLLATRRRDYWLITSETDDQAMKHQASVKAMLESPRLIEDYPHLRAKVQSVRKQLAAWSSERLICAGGQQIEFTSLMGKMRGFKSSEGKRPDLWTPDDIDSPTESPDVTKKKREIMRLDFLPALARNRAGELLGSVIWPQNLIHRNSVMRQVMDFSADMLNDRVFIGPNPLMRWYDAERTIQPNGKPKWIITDGQPFDPSVSLAYCEQLLNQFGKDGFDRECQQLVDVVDAEKDFREYNEIYHVSTLSEVIAGFKRNGASLPPRGYPDRWEVGEGLDIGTTPAHPCVYTAFTRPDQRFPFSDVHLGIIERCLPKYPLTIGVEPEKVSPRRIARAIRQSWRDVGISESHHLSRMSHESSIAMNAFLLDVEDDDEQVFFAKWKAQKGSGVPAIQNLMEIDYSRPHPFRVYPAGHAQAGQPVMGYTRFILVVADGQGELYCDNAGFLRVKGAVDEHGFARARYEIPLYSHRNQGKSKIDDDWVDAARGILVDFILHAGELTHTERIEAATPEFARLDTLRKQSPTGRLEMADQLTYEHNRRAAIEKVEKQSRQVWRRDAMGNEIHRVNDWRS